MEAVIIKKLLKILKAIIIFILIQALVFVCFSIPMIFYGPFETLRDTLVMTAMETFHHQYIATTFLSEKKIKDIMDKYTVVAKENTDESAISVYNNNALNKDEDKNIDNIDLIDVSRGKFKGYMLEITNPYRVILGRADNIGSNGMKLEEIIKKYNGIGGINAGGFSDNNGKGNGGIPEGILIENGNVIVGTEGVHYGVIGFNEDAVLVLGNFTLKDMREKKIKYATSFGPFLIVNGQSLAGIGGSLEPRTVIGQKKDGTVLLLVIDGRQIGSVGATLKDAQDIMVEHGAYNAANLDGGASTGLWYEDKYVNHPCSTYGPRSIPTAFVVKN